MYLFSLILGFVITALGAHMAYARTTGLEFTCANAHQNYILISKLNSDQQVEKIRHQEWIPDHRGDLILNQESTSEVRSIYLNSPFLYFYSEDLDLNIQFQLIVKFQYQKDETLIYSGSLITLQDDGHSEIIPMTCSLI